jgi:SAM-dependent methyltransferase
MGTEASKTKEIWNKDDLRYLAGDGIDIGAGADLIVPNAVGFDLEQGDANRIDEYIHRQFDFVFSSHCLEHMYDPVDAIKRWWSLVKPGGYMILLVPDEDLYEQGYWPSLFNSDHKNTFTLKSEKSWSPVSVNVYTLVATLSECKVIDIQLQSNGYQKNKIRRKFHSRNGVIFRRKFAKKISKIFWLFGAKKFIRNWLEDLLQVPIDQTSFNNALAQIQIRLQKIEA